MRGVRLRSRLALIALLAALGPRPVSGETLPPLPHSDLYVSGFFAASIHRYYGPRSAQTGPHPAPEQANATYAPIIVRRPWGLAFGPDGNLYVANSSGATPGIVRVDGPFSDTPGTAHAFVEAGAFFEVAFGPDGNLYAAGHGPVQRFDIVSGLPIDQFTHGYELDEVRGLAFGSDGYLYVSNFDGCVDGPTGCPGTRGEIVRFDALSGEFVDIYVRHGEGGLDAPWKIAFGTSGDLFVVNWTPEGNNILRYRPRPRSIRRLPSGAPRAAGTLFIVRSGWSPLYLAFGPDGNLYVSNSDNSGSAGSILRFDGKTGAFLDTFVADVPGSPRGIAFAPGVK
jgi:DNA-binding beta-propeller fold protein YncE